MNAIFSLVYWVFLAVSAVVLYLWALAIWVLTAPFDPARLLLHWYTCRWALLYLRCLPGCRLRVEGRERIARRTPYVLVANHQSMTDIMALSALALPFKWVSKKETFQLPFIGWNMYLNRYVKVDRGNIRSVVSTMAECRRWLEHGVPVLMFPEGRRSRSGELQPFHSGAFKLAGQCGCAVIPIVVDGTRPIYRGFRVRAFPGPIRVRVLSPITMAEAGGKVERFRDEVHRLMAATLKDMRGESTGATMQAQETGRPSPVA